MALIFYVNKGFDCGNSECGPGLVELCDETDGSRNVSGHVLQIYIVI